MIDFGSCNLKSFLISVQLSPYNTVVLPIQCLPARNFETESVTFAGQLLQKNLASNPNAPHVLQLAAFHTFASTSLGLVDDPASEINKAINYLSHGIKFVNQADPIYLYLFVYIKSKEN